MRIYVDISSLVTWSESLTGVQRVEYNFMHHLLDSPEISFLVWDNNQTCFCRPSKRMVREMSGVMSTGGHIHQAAKSYQHRLKDEQHQPVSFLESDFVIVPGYLFGYPDHTNELARVCQQAKVIQVVHEALPVFGPEIVVSDHIDLISNYMRVVLPGCFRIAPNSKNTAEGIEQYFHDWGLTRLPKFIPCHFGVDLEKVSSKPKAVSHKHFVLSVGTLSAAKNYALLIQVYRLARERKIDFPHLYIAGQDGIFADDLNHQLDCDPYISTKITRLGYMDNQQLAWLYQNALFTIFPSYYDAYGLPVAESLAYGAVTLASDRGGVPEVGREFADYFSTYSSEQLFKLMCKYQDESQIKVRQKQIRVGYENTTWAEAIHKFKAELVKLANQKRSKE